MHSPRLILLALCLLCGAGCNRAFYRTQADAEANCLVDQKASLVGSESTDLRIDIDPRSRMYSPNNPDCPPMPPDDPVSHTLLECVDCKRGACSNRCAERTPFVENPDWLSHLPRDERGRLVLDLTAAVDIGLMHSPEYQEALEELYLSALDVSFERFRFDTQFFGGSSIFYTADGRDRSGTGNSSSLLDVSPSRSGNRFRMEKLSATGGELVVGFANSLVWQFAGPDDYSSTTLLDFTLLQPLLRTGGRTFVLERLTIAERALLANVRAMERFRRGFYLNIATGRDPGGGPSRRGGVFGGSGLEGFTGVGGGGFGNLGGGGNGTGFSGGAGAAAAGGYVGLLQQAQVLRNQRGNITALRGSVEQLAASYDAGRIDRFQVDLARQALFNAQSQLLSAEADFQSTVDDFLVDLGLPPSIDLELSDSMLDPFQLRSPELTGLQTDTVETAAALRAIERGDSVTEEQPAAETESGQPEEIPRGPLLVESGGSSDEAEASPAEPPPKDSPVKQPVELLARSQNLAVEAKRQLDLVEADFETLLKAVPSRREHLAQLAQRDEVATAQIDANLLAPARLDGRVQQLRDDLDAVSTRLEGAVRKIGVAAASPSPGEAAELRPAVSDLSSLLLELSLLQARARLDTIDIDPTDLTAEDALAIASLYRRDWKNARAALVDSWRLVNFNANDLLSDLDIVFSGDIGNVGDNPFRLRDTNGRLRVGLEFDGPITRLSERNVYRQSLIEYQQARRSYYQFVDRVYQGLRAQLRQVRLNEINFELRREAVLVAIAQVDLTQLRLTEPPKPGEESQFGDTTARDLVQALSDLLNVQNDFLSVWVNNQVQLLNLELDLGLMELDAVGQRVPLAMPLEDFLQSAPCPHPGGPERSTADVVLAPTGPVSAEQPCLPSLPEETPPLLFTPEVLGNPQDSRVNPPQESLLQPISFEEPVPGPAPRRLPTP